MKIHTVFLVVLISVVQLPQHVTAQTCPKKNTYDFPACDKFCFCLNNVACDAYNGMCPTRGLCEPLYHGPKCNFLKPRLLDTPNVTHDGCGEVTVSWNEWVKDKDPGNGTSNIIKYQVIIRSNGNSNVVNLTLSDRSYKYKIIEGVFYEFSINTVFETQHSEPTNVIGAPSPYSTNRTWTCTAVPLIEQLEVKVDATSLIMNWTVKRSSISSAGNVENISLLWEAIQIGDCFNYTPPLQNTSESTKAISSFTVDTGLHWTRFRVTLTATDSLGKSSKKSVTVLTGEKAPNGTVLEFKTKALTETSVNLTWSPPACENRGGALKGYLVNINDVETGKPAKIGVTLKTREYALTGLQPGTTYSASITFENSIDKGPVGVFNFTMAGTKPTTTTKATTTPTTAPTIATTKSTPAPTTTSTPEPTTTTTTTTRTSKAIPTTTTTIATTTASSAPTMTTDFLVTTHVSPSVPLPSDVKTQAQAAQKSVILSWTISGDKTGVTYKLKCDPVIKNFPLSVSAQPYTVQNLDLRKTYKFSVASVKNGVTSAWVPAKPVMLLGDSEKVTGLSNVTIQNHVSSSSTFKWNTLADKQKFTGFYFKVKVIQRLASSGAGSEKNVGDKLQHTVSLPWAAQLEITVDAIFSDNNYDARGPASDPLTFWTGPGPMANEPPKPKISSVKQTTVDVQLEPLTSYSTGPLQYYLAIEQNSKRKRRALSSSDLSLPTNARIIYNNIKVPTTVKVGNGTKSSNNPPLSPSSNYTLYFVARSYVPQAQSAGLQQKFSEIPTTTAAAGGAPAAAAGLSTWVIILIVLLILLLLIIILILVLLFIRRRERARRGEWDQNLKLTLHANGTAQGQHHHLPVTFQHWSEPERLYDPRYMVLDPAYGPRDLKVESLRNRHGDQDFESFEKEYKSLPWGLDHDCSTGRLPENASKNRNSAILPYDHCRVILDRLGTGTHGTDYINASFIDGYVRRRAYIAAQSPFDEPTVADFWLMIYQCNVLQIVMLSEIFEEAVMKCTQYWPEVGSSEQFGAVQVTCKSEEQFAHHSIRTFHILLNRGKARGAMQTVQQFQFRSWPEHGVPHTPIPLLDFYMRVKLRTAQHMGPMVVHCGTGVSRTAVFIALDSLLQQAIHENVVNVFKFCNKMRRARPNMIRTAKQYMFLYDLLFEALLASNSIVNLDVRETLRELMRKNEQTGHTLLWEQHCILEKYTTGPPDTACSAALRADNLVKNRLPTILPSDEDRVRLFSGPVSADYINAIFVESLFAPEDVILTQVPSHATLNDFWRMLLDQLITCVVDLEPNHGGRENAVAWMPSNNTTAVFGDFSVRTILESDPNEMVVVRRCIINDNKHSVKVLTLRPGSWDEPYSKIPADRSAMVALTHALLTDARGPIVFLCLDGATRTGLGALCFLCAQRLFTEHFVDVFHTVRAVKQRRRQVIAHLDQYRFIFKLLQEFVRRHMSGHLQRELKTESLYGHLPTGDLESVYSHTQLPVLHTSHGVGDRQSGVHYRYASSELLNDTIA